MSRNYYTLLTTIFLSISGLTAAFNAMTGTIAVGRGVIILLSIILLISIMDVYIRFEDLAESL